MHFLIQTRPHLRFSNPNVLQKGLLIQDWVFKLGSGSGGGLPKTAADPYARVFRDGVKLPDHTSRQRKLRAIVYWLSRENKTLH